MIDRTILATLAWVLALVAGCDLLAAQMGLKYLQEVEWPTDLYTLGRIAADVPVDVGVVGSSRSHYGLAPTAIDRCLASAVGRPTRTVNLTRLTASAYAEDMVARDFLSGEDTPDVMVVEIAPETMNRYHFELDYNIASTGEVWDIPECLADSLRPSHVVSCLRPAFRGVENLAQLADRPLSDHRHITWMMLYAGGGQYCYGTQECQARNADYDRRFGGRFDKRMRSLIPKVRSERFDRWDITTGLPRAHFEALVARGKADGAKVVVVNLPVAREYQAEIPSDTYAFFQRTMAELSQRHGFVYVDANTPEWQARRGMFLDPDHLNSQGALRMSNELCREALIPALR